MQYANKRGPNDDKDKGKKKQQQQQRIGLPSV
jgi:hypothetical protein